MAFIIHYTLQMFFNDNQLLQMHTHIINLSLHLSLTSCFGNHLLEILILQLIFFRHVHSLLGCVVESYHRRIFRHERPLPDKRTMRAGDSNPRPPSQQPSNNPQNHGALTFCSKSTPCLHFEEQIQFHIKTIIILNSNTSQLSLIKQRPNC